MLIILVKIIIPIIKAELIINPNMKQYFLGAELLEFICMMYFARPMIRILSYDIKKQFVHDGYKKYNLMSFEAKLTYPMSKFSRLLQNSSHAIYMVIDWGLMSIANILGVIISTCYIFYKKDFLYIAIIFALLLLICYYKVILKMQIIYNKFAKDERITRRAINEKLTMSSSPFQYKERTTDYMFNMHENIINGSQSSDIKRQVIIDYIKAGVKLCTIFICYMFVSPSEFIIVYMTLNKLDGILVQTTNFLNQFNRMCDDYNAYNTSWPDKSQFSSEPLSLFPTKDLIITSIDIKRGSFRVTADFNINFYKGVKILIRGSSGDGKSTLINGITGKIPGVQFNYGSPENYYHNTADMYQDIRENLPSSKVTVRDYFQDESNNALIEQYIKLTFKPNEYIKWIGNLSTDNPFDVHINNKISGGQKSRLILATRAYEIDKNKKNIIILDEPEQGSDTNTIIMVLSKFFERYHDKTIIMISHMCPCQLNTLNITWDYELNVSNGVVSSY